MGCSTPLMTQAMTHRDSKFTTKDIYENQSNGKIRNNDIKCEIYLLTFSSGKNVPWDG